MYGRKAKDRKNPDTNPQMCAKLSIQGSKPKEKKKAEKARSLAKARNGRSRICQLWNNSTNRQARMPNWLPAGPTWEERGTRLWQRGLRCLQHIQVQIWLRKLFLYDMAAVTVLLGLLVTLHLCSVGQEDGRGQIACDAAEHVDDGDSQPASQLLYVPQHCHLKEHWHQAVQDPTGTDETLIQSIDRLSCHLCRYNG